MGPYEYRVRRQSVFSGAGPPMSRREHREKLLRTPLRVLKNEVAADDGEETDEELESSALPSPLRNFDCENYEICLNLAAALNWPSFTCKGCDGTIDPAVLKKAEIAIHADSALEPLIGNFSSKK